MLLLVAVEVGVERTRRRHRRAEDAALTQQGARDPRLARLQVASSGIPASCEMAFESSSPAQHSVVSGRSTAVWD